MGITEGQDTKDAKYILKRLEADGRTEISKRDLYQLCNGKFKDVDSMDPGLNVLTGRGYVRIDKVKTGGRPTEKIYINPKRFNNCKSPGIHDLKGAFEPFEPIAILRRL